MADETIYASVVDIRSELSGGAERGDQSYMDESQLHEALVVKSARHATRDINGKLEKTYPGQVPYAASGDVPLLLQSIANDLAVYYIKRAQHPGPGPMSAEVKSEYWDKPMAMLDDIADRKMMLGGLGSTSDDVYDANAGYVPVFDVDPIEDQFLDPNRLEDIVDARDD